MAVGANVSGLIAQVAAALPDGTRVLAPEPEFVSLLFPFLAQAERGVTVEVVPLDRLAEAIDARTDVVAVSAVQSSTGEVADLDAIEAAARHHGALTVIDATHGIGWLPFDASRYDAVACACYKWLMCPRGTAFMVLTEALEERMTPHQAGWFAAADPLKDQFGPPLRLGDGARRFDTSPAWFSWVGTEPALQLLNEIGVRDDPRARPRARQPLPRRARAGAERLRDRLHRLPRRDGEARAGGGHGRRPRGPSQGVISSLQHRGRRRRGPLSPPRSR